MGGVDDDRREEGENGEGGRQEPIIAFPPGFLFAPSDEEIVSYYLRGKNEGESPTITIEGLIVEYNIYGCNPWELPRHRFRYPGTQKDMYFFTPTATGGGQGKRRARTAGCGVWHGNGRDNLIRGRGWDYSMRGSLAVIGHKTSFKFEMKSDEASSSSSTSKRKSRIKTDWLMHEYRLQPRDADPIPRRFVLCRIYEKEKAANGDDDVDSLPPQLQAPQPKRKRPVPDAMSPADAADPFSPDTPLDMLSWEGVEDQGPTPKRRRVVQPEPEPEEEPEHQPEEALSDDSFAALSPLPLSSAPYAPSPSAHQPGSPSWSSSSWDDLSALELDALLFADGYGDGLPSSPPLPSTAPPYPQLMPGAAAPDHPGCPSSSYSVLASSLQQLDELLSRPPSPSPPSSSPLTAGLDPLPPWSEFAEDWRARFDPFYDDSNFALHSF